MHFDSKVTEPKTDLAQIVNIEGNYIFVKVVSEGCKNCAISGICKLQDKVQKFKVDNIQNFKSGDFVEIVIQSGSRIFSAFMIFIFPLIFMIAAYFIAFSILHLNENISAAASFAGLIIGGIALKLSDKKLGEKITYKIKKWSYKDENTS